MNRAAWALLLLCACKSGTDTQPECEAARPCSGGQICQDGRCVEPPDLAPGIVDLAMQQPDLSMPGPDLSEPACSGPRLQYATSAVTLPRAAMTFAIDIDGDGRADNALRSLISAVTGAGFDLDTAVNEAVAAGQWVHLLELRAPDLVSSSCLRLDAHTAEPFAMGRPKYDGTDRFTIPAGQPPAELTGAIAASALSTTRPPDLKPDAAQELRFYFPLGGALLPIPLRGVHVSVGQVASERLIRGEIHGVISATDMDTVVIPGVATMITQQINSDPGSGTSQALIRLFEDPAGISKAKCMVAADCCATSPRTCKITPEEVRGNALIKNVLAPDVQVFDGDRWKPVPGGASKDALSVGFGVSAVRASF